MHADYERIIGLEIDALRDALATTKATNRADKEALDEARRICSEVEQPILVPNSFYALEARLQVHGTEMAHYSSYPVIISAGQCLGKFGGHTVRWFGTALCVEFYRIYTEQMRCQRRRLEKLSEYLHDVRQWSTDRITKELDEREKAIGHQNTHGVLLATKFKLFRTEIVLTEDPNDLQQEFNRSLLPELRRMSTVVPPDSGIDPVVSSVVNHITKTVHTKIQLEFERDELKKRFPQQYHAEIDRQFRRAMDELSER